MTLEKLPFIQNIFTDVLFLAPINIQAKLLKDTLGDNPLYYYNYRYIEGLNTKHSNTEHIGIPNVLRFRFPMVQF